MPRAKDKFWEYAEDLKGRFRCNFCKKDYSGGASRLKAHLSCLQGRDVINCPLVPEDVQAAAVLSMNKETKETSNKRFKVGSSSDVEGSQKLSGISSQNSSSLHQVTLPIMVDKKNKAFVDHELANAFFDNNIPFNVIQSKSFLRFCKALSDFGSGYVVPSYSTLRTKLVQNAKVEAAEYVSQVKESWSLSGSGCTLMSDGWTDMKGRSFINMIAYSPKGDVFLSCFEESSERKTGVFLKSLLCMAIEEIGPNNVVQIITDNASNYENAGQMVMDVYPHIYKSRCATHGVQLLLKDIDKEIEWIQNVFKDAKDIVDFIYRYPMVTALLRKMTNNKELKRPCKTRFAYNFLMLQSILEVEDGLRNMVASPEWRGMKYSTEAMGMKITECIQGVVFWKKGTDVVTILEPLVRVLRLVDGEGSTAGYLFEVMERVREELKHRCDNDPARYHDFLKLFDKRRDENILHPIHALAAFLNPQYMMRGKIKYDSPDVKKGLLFAITKLISSETERKDFCTQISMYNTKHPDIFSFIAKHQMETIHPRVWWAQNGGLIPIVQKLAIRILSQPCSASACERNWSAFEAAQTKKRNKLSSEMLEDLVFIRMNTKMKDNCEDMEQRDTKTINLEHLGAVSEYEEYVEEDYENIDVDTRAPTDIMFEELFPDL